MIQYLSTKMQRLYICQKLSRRHVTPLHTRPYISISCSPGLWHQTRNTKKLFRIISRKFLSCIRRDHLFSQTAAFKSKFKKFQTIKNNSNLIFLSAAKLFKLKVWCWAETAVIWFVLWRRKTRASAISFSILLLMISIPIS